MSSRHRMLLRLASEFHLSSPKNRLHKQYSIASRRSSAQSNLINLRFFGSRMEDSNVVPLPSSSNQVDSNDNSMNHDDMSLEGSSNDSKVRLTKAEKRAKKEADRKEFWKLKRPLERAAKKRKRAERIKEITLAGGNPREELITGKDNPIRKLKRRKLEDTQFSEQKVVIDLGFDDEMSEKDIKSLASQLTYIYSKNRSVENPLQVTFTDYGGKLEKQLSSTNGFANWVGLNLKPKSYLEEFPKEKLVYLSAESDNSLETLNEDDIYIIGGLVDHNRLKGICHNKAVEQGIRTARLPIDEFIAMKTRKVLTVNQVFEILLYYSIEKDWRRAFEVIIPKRKGAALKNEDEQNEAQNQTQQEKINTEMEETQDEKTQDGKDQLNQELNEQKEQNNVGTEN